eukprot:g4697.t1
MKPGERVRLRFINAGAMSYFDVRIPGLKMTVVEADGQAVRPVSVDEFRIAVAETYDVIVEPKEDDAYQIIAEAMDRSGFAIGQLSGTQGALVILPPQRKRHLLTMDDMGGEHAGMDHAQHRADTNENTSDMDHSTMDHAAMGHAMPMGMGIPPVTRDNEHVPPMDAPEGTRVLTYQDLVALTPNDDLREPDRELTMTLGGNMERYIWTLNGDKFSEATPIYLDYGQRVRITYVNDTMMNHPMHLHGMFVELENGQPPANRPRKHIVNVGPGRRYAVTFTADEAGEWAFHCHLLYHMASGMMSKVLVSQMLNAFWDGQVGIRIDAEPTSLLYGVIGVHGLAPQFIETDIALFLSEDGDAHIRFEGDLDIHLTQRLRLTPFLETDLYLQDVDERHRAQGLATLETGLQVAYDIRREIAPYIELNYETGLGATRSLMRQEGEAEDALTLRAGLHFWFN